MESIYGKESYSQSKVLYLAGPIEYWWQEDRFDTPLAVSYRWWRDELSRAFVKADFLVYRPWEAFKGPWNERMQILNDVAVEKSDVLLNLTPSAVPTGLGTQHEIDFARDNGVPVIHLGFPFAIEHVDGYGGYWWEKQAIEILKNHVAFVDRVIRD
jgi:hypothetical protein